MIRIKQAIELQNARQRAKNEKNGAPSHVGCVSKSNLGRLLFPTLKRKAPLIRMSKLLKESVTVRPEWVGVVCKACEVDPNFLFGFPSKHDKDFEKLINQ